MVAKSGLIKDKLLKIINKLMQQKNVTQNFIKEYDFIFSLGEACSCASALITLGFRKSSFVFDWLYGGGYLGRANIVANKFDKFIEKRDLRYYSLDNRNEKMDAYKNNYNSLIFNHDFPKGIPFDESFCVVKEKYDRRIQRLLNILECTKNRVLLVYLESPMEDHVKIDDYEIVKGINLIRNNKDFKAHIDLIYINLSKNFSVNTIHKGVTRIFCDYKQWNSSVNYEVDYKKLKFLSNLLKLKKDM
ncbi:MAG: papain-like cysteine peptidase [Endomicrobium sp.]|jgi:hypothetical protein|nr:papain-like cysteine peptidase [Endomicrobium sp.]